MQAKIQTGYYTVEVSTSLIRYKAQGQRRWRVLFDGRTNGQRFAYTIAAIKEIPKCEFDDELDLMLRDKLAQPGAIWVL